MSWPKQLSCLAGPLSTGGLNSQKRLQAHEETSEPPRAIKQAVQSTEDMPVEAKSATAVVLCRPLAPAKEYFDALVKRIKLDKLTFPVCKTAFPSSSFQTEREHGSLRKVPSGVPAEPPTQVGAIFCPILLPAEWHRFQSACEEAETQLKHALNQLEQSWMKGYLLGQEKKVVQNLLHDGLAQVQQVHQAALELVCHLTSANWQSLQQALSKLTEISTREIQPSDSQAVKTSIGWIKRVWNEAQYFLAPVVITGWGLLNKLNVLAEAITKNVPIIGGLIGLILTIYQRIAVRIHQIKTEDRDQLIDLCHSLTNTFEDLRRKQSMEHIFAQTQNTVAAAQAATNAAQEASAAKQELIELKQENERLTKLIESQQIKIEEQSQQLQNITASQQQILALLTNPSSSQPLTGLASTNTSQPSAPAQSDPSSMNMPPVDKKA